MAHILIVEARFYEDIANMQLAGAGEALKAAGHSFERVTVPGALEAPAVVAMAAQSRKYDGFVVLGCVIRGETYHFEVVSNESARGLMELSIQQRLPIGNGILTVESRDQAVHRADPQRKNKGADAAKACLAMLELQRRFGA